MLLILLGGAGALAYVMLFNKQASTTIPATDPEDGSAGSAGSAGDDGDKSDAEPKSKDKDRSNKRKGDRDRDRGDKGERDKSDKSDKSSESAAKAAAADAANDADKATSKTTPKKGKQVAVADNMTWREISDAAKKAEASGDWDDARQLYERLQKAKGYQYAGYAVYKQGAMAFQANDTTDAVTLAKRASNMPGNHKLLANELYADALFKQGDFKHAKDFYIQLRKKVPDAKKPQLAKKIALCNQKLKLPERDGL